MLVVSMILLFYAIAMFVYFFGCDPIANHEIVYPNQMPSYFILKALSEQAPSWAGISLASTLCFGIVQHSAGLVHVCNSFVAEIVEPLGFKLSNQLVKRALIALIGGSSILYAVALKSIQATNLVIFFVINNAINSPILGLFLLAALNPYANSFGALLAFSTSVATTSWMAAGKFVFSTFLNQDLPVTDFACEATSIFGNHSTSFVILNATSSSEQNLPNSEFLAYMYSFGSNWYGLFSVAYIMLVGSLASLAYSLIRSRSADYDSEFSEERRKYVFHKPSSSVRATAPEKY